VFEGARQDKRNGGRSWFFSNDFNKNGTSIVNISTSSLLVPDLCTTIHSRRRSRNDFRALNTKNIDIGARLTLTVRAPLISRNFPNSPLLKGAKLDTAPA
jgi:hypothetical protein